MSAKTTFKIVFSGVLSVAGFFLSIYAIDDYSYTKQCEGLAADEAPPSQSTLRNQVVNALGAGLPINFPWTKNPVNYDIAAYLAVYGESLRTQLRRL